MHRGGCAPTPVTRSSNAPWQTLLTGASAHMRPKHGCARWKPACSSSPSGRRSADGRQAPADLFALVEGHLASPFVVAGMNDTRFSRLRAVMRIALAVFFIGGLFLHLNSTDALVRI